MNIRNQEEFQNALTLLRAKPYVMGLRVAQHVYGLLAQQCNEFSIEGVDAFVGIDVNFEMNAKTKTEPTGYSFHGEWYKTGTHEVTTGGFLGKIQFGFVIKETKYVIYECNINFGNTSKGDMPWCTEAGFISDRVKPKILHTLELLKFLREQDLVLVQEG